MYRRLGRITATTSLAIALAVLGAPTSTGAGDDSKNLDALDASGPEAAVVEVGRGDGLKNVSPAPILSTESPADRNGAVVGGENVDTDSIAQAFAAAISSAPIIASSTDVPVAIPDTDPLGITSTLVAPDMVIADLNLIFDDVSHTCIPDLHIELTSPSGTTVEIVKAFTEGGILQGLGCPDDFVDTILDDDAPTNLQSGTGPYTGSFNVEHASVVANPLSTFDGENAAGTWTLFIADLGSGDVGTLNAWSLELAPAGPPATTIPSTDVPVAIPDTDPLGITSTLVAPDMVIADLNLIFDDVSHTCIPDLHIELTSPSGTTVEIVKAFTEGGILQGLGCPDDFVDTILDDDAPTNLQSGTGPYTGSFNVEHASVVANPLSTFDGENAAGTWTLFIADLGSGDVGTLNAWSLELTPEAIPTPTPTPTPALATPTPTPTPTPPPTAPIQGEIKTKVQLKFNKLSKDKISVQIKNWSLPPGLVPTDVTVDVGGAALTGTLDTKGKFKSLDGRDAIKMKQSKKTQLWKITVKRKNNDFAADLADEGLTNAENPKPGLPVIVPLTIEVGGDTYSRDLSLVYTSKLGKKGTAQ